MKKLMRLSIILAILYSPIIGQILDIYATKGIPVFSGSPFLPLTQREVYYYPQSDSIDFDPRVKTLIKQLGSSKTRLILTFIHPLYDILYYTSGDENWWENELLVEKQLKQNYDIIFLKIDRMMALNDLSLYNLAQSTSLAIDGNSTNCLGLYDYSIMPIGGEIGEGFVNIKGYLLFRKELNVDLSKNVELTVGLADTTVQWNVEKINKMIEVFNK